MTARRRKPHVNDDDNILWLILVDCEDPESSFLLPFWWASLLEKFNQASDNPKIVSPLPSELRQPRNWRLKWDVQEVSCLEKSSRISKLILEESRIQDHLFLCGPLFLPIAFSLVASNQKKKLNLLVSRKD